MPVLATDRLIDNRVHAIRSYHEQTGIPRAEIDVSGGIDSATLLHLAERAVGAEHITAVYTGITSSQDSLDRARDSAASCGVRLIEVELSAAFASMTEHLLDAAAAAGHDRAAIERHMAADPTVLGSFRSCLRAPIGRALNRMLAGGIRHGTGNECEDRFLRFYQKGGDGEVDSNPIAMLSKGEVFQCAAALGVPRSVLTAVPSPDLHGTGEDHNDEDELEATYGVPWTYSKVAPDTGAYREIGTIERMARILDDETVERLLFGDTQPSDAQFLDLARRATQGPFRGFDEQEVLALCRSARHIERVTRHKWNPNCPTLGTREDLLAAEILTNTLPDIT